MSAPRLTVLVPYDVDEYIFGVLPCRICGRQLPACASYFVADRSEPTGIKNICRDCKRDSERKRC